MKTLLLSLLLMPVVAWGQVTHGSGGSSSTMTGAQIRTALGDSVGKAGNAPTGLTATGAQINHSVRMVYNILDAPFNAPTNGSSDASVAIQSAINAANAAANGGTVVVPPGSYSLQHPDTIKSYVNLVIMKGAFVSVPSGYTGSAFVYAPVDVRSSEISGGGLLNEAAPRSYNWTAIDMSTIHTGAIVYNRVNDLYIAQCATGINMNAADTSWINDNRFEDIIFDGCRQWLKTRKSATSLGIDVNRFTNITFQMGSNTVFGIDSLTGASNQFSYVFDYDNANHVPDAVLAAGSSTTTITGGNIGQTAVYDLGTGNLIKTPFGGTDVAPSVIADSTINWMKSSTFTKTIGAAQRFVFTNIPEGKVINVAVTASGSYACTWVTAVVWKAGSAPTQTASKTDVYTFYRIGGVTYGSASQNY